MSKGLPLSLMVSNIVMHDLKQYCLNKLDMSSKARGILSQGFQEVMRSKGGIRGGERDRH